MQVWFESDYILMYSTHNNGKSVIAERFIKTLKANIYEKMKLMNNNINTIIFIIILLIKNLLMLLILLWLKNKVPKCKVNDIVIIKKYKNVSSKGYTENWSR